MDASSKPIAILGAGTWGLALAKLLWERNHRVQLWDFYPAVIDRLKSDRSHPRLPGLRIPDSALLTSSLAEAMRGAEVAVVVVPSTAVRSTTEKLRAERLADGIHNWIICSKGIEGGTLMLMHDVMIDVLGPDSAARMSILTGPSHAEEVAQGLPALVVASSINPDAARETQTLFFSQNFRVYRHDDVIGAELGGALKNVVAIAAGAADGMGFGDSTRAALITRSLAEMVRLGVAMGARLETFMGLAGIGDLIVTASSKHSRNHQFGELLARDRSPDQALKEVGMVVEGYNTAKAARALGQKYRVEMPICEVVHRVIFEGLPPSDGLKTLLSRVAKSEMPG